MERNTRPTADALLKRVSVVTVLGNVILTVFKLFAGVVGRSGAMVSDAVHSLSDVFTTLIAFLGVRLSQKPADKEHPYGHERFECVASLVLGLILLITGLGIGKVGLDNILAGSYADLTPPGPIALIAALLSIATKEAMFWYTRHYAKLLNSPLLWRTRGTTAPTPFPPSALSSAWAEPCWAGPCWTVWPA